MNKTPRGLEKVQGYAAVAVLPGTIAPDVELLLQLNEHTFGLNAHDAIATGYAILACARDAGWLDAPGTEDDPDAYRRIKVDEDRG